MRACFFFGRGWCCTHSKLFDKSTLYKGRVASRRDRVAVFIQENLPRRVRDSTQQRAPLKFAEVCHLLQTSWEVASWLPGPRTSRTRSLKISERLRSKKFLANFCICFKIFFRGSHLKIPLLLRRLAETVLSVSDDAEYRFIFAVLFAASSLMWKGAHNTQKKVCREQKKIETFFNFF